MKNKVISTHHPLLFAMPNVNFVVFGADKKYHRNALTRMRKVLANTKL